MGLGRTRAALLEPGTVFRMDEGHRDLGGRHDAALLDPEDSVHVVRPGDLAGDEIVLEAAHVRDALRMGHAFAALNDLELGALALGDIMQGAEDVDRPSILGEMDVALAPHEALFAVRTHDAKFVDIEARLMSADT